MKRLREVDLKLNKEKCVFAQSELKFLGHKFTKSGIEQEGNNVSAILEMPEPTSVPLLRQIMGMVHYLARIFRISMTLESLSTTSYEATLCDYGN